VVDFTTGETSLCGARGTWPRAGNEEQRSWNPVEAQQLLAERLVTRQQQAARIATRVGLAHQLEKRDDVLVIGDDAVEFLQQG